MDRWIFILYAIAGIVASAMAAIKNMHMFQLNSYKAATHWKWLRANPAKLWSQIFILLISLPMVLNSHGVLRIILMVIFVMLWFLNKPLKNAKKPLVYTSRVKRMLAAVAVLLSGGLALSYVFLLPYRYLVISLLYLIAPVMPVIANLMNAPIEAAVRRYYINDAKKILKSCPNLIIIGITGSYGKTSVKYYLTTLLKAKYNVLMTPESFNTPMGVVKTIREELRSTHEIFVCEMGARYEGDIKEICDIVFPTHGMLTSIGEQHLETFKTAETIIKTKFELIDAVKGKGMAFLNGDNGIIGANLPHQDYQTYGCNSNNHFFAYDIKVTSNGTTFSVNCNGEIVTDLQTQLIGEHNVTNLVGAIAMSSYLGVPAGGIRTQLKKISAPPHRLQLVKNNGMIIIDDAYNSNPNGCEAALKALSLFDGDKILITPGMVELGARQNECNYIFGTKASGVCDYVVLVGEKQTKPIYEGLKSAGYDSSRIFVANTFKEAIAKAYSLASDRPKIILLENDLPDNY